MGYIKQSIILVKQAVLWINMVETRKCLRNNSEKSFIEFYENLSHILGADTNK